MRGGLELSMRGALRVGGLEVLGGLWEVSIRGLLGGLLGVSTGGVVGVDVLIVATRDFE